jgi:hypothetical protein
LVYLRKRVSVCLPIPPAAKCCHRCARGAGVGAHGTVPHLRAGPFQGTPPSSAGAPWTLHLRVESGELPPEPRHTKLGSISPALTGEKGKSRPPEVGRRWGETNAVPSRSREERGSHPTVGGANCQDFQCKSPQGPPSESSGCSTSQDQRELTKTRHFPSTMAGSVRALGSSTSSHLLSIVVVASRGGPTTRRLKSPRGLSPRGRAPP